MSPAPKIQCGLCMFVILGLALIVSYSNNNVSAEELPLSKLTQNVGAPTLKFLYW